MNPTSKRRRFQPPITTFFPSSPTDSRPDPLRSHPLQPEPLVSPPLPHHIQSSLLTVGMRIRKSVPEGYKTSLTSKISNFFLDSVSGAVAEPEATTPHGGRSTTGFAELAPYCGIMKTGGLAVQAFPPSSHASSDPYSLPSSQESAFSTDSMPAANPNKRALDESEDEETTNIWDESNPLSPDFRVKGTHRRGSSYPFSHTRMPNFNTLLAMSNPTNTPSRPLARPKTRLKRPDLGQENAFAMSMVGHMEGLEEFEDAAFLRRREDVEMDG